MNKQRVLTGITTTGTPHLGNHVGAIRPAIEASRAHDVLPFYFMADYHALIKCEDPERVRQSSLEIAATWLALGLDTDNAVFYRQSDIPEIMELTWILTCVTAKGLMNRAHAYKAAVAANEESGEKEPDKGITMGLFNYPILMAADILMFNADKVPVGKDQVQHLEMARDIAGRFNHLYGEHFVLPEAVVDEHSATLAGLDGRKMSKSYNNTIPLFLPEKKFRKLIMKIKTNSLEPGEPKDSDGCTLFGIYQAFATRAETAAMRDRYANGIGWGEMKQELFEYLNEVLKAPRERYEALLQAPDHIEDQLRKGAERRVDTASLFCNGSVKRSVSGAWPGDDPMPASPECLERTVDKQTLIGLFSEFLDPDVILSDEEDLRPYECDGLSCYRRLPWLVLLPDTIEQVQRIVRLCHRHAVPVVARGAGTGLSGGALPLDNGVLLSLAKFNRILELDPLNRTARVQPGVRNLAISQAVEVYGLYYAPDPSSQIACTIGGNVAENAGGVHCLKYGLTVHNILRLVLVTIEGEIVTVGGSGLDGPGYDLLALMTGSEGMLAIIVEITVKLLPTPEYAQVLLAAFDSVEQAGGAVAAVIAGGFLPAGLEMMDNLAIRAAEDFVHAGYPVDAAAILLCELDGPRRQVRDDVDQVRKLLVAHGATAVRCSEDEAERERMWAGRKAAFPAVGRIAPDYYCMDGTIPRKRLAEVLKRISEMSAEYSLPVANVFHAGDGNLHPLILYDANRPGELERVEAFGGKILELCVAVGGTITGEHGVGAEKIDQMCVQFDSAELTQFHAVKAAFDPLRLLNPGKAVPTLHRCAEFGAMHVHRGNLPHSELERF